MQPVKTSTRKRSSNGPSTPSSTSFLFFYASFSKSLPSGYKATSLASRLVICATIHFQVAFLCHGWCDTPGGHHSFLPPARSCSLFSISQVAKGSLSQFIRPGTVLGSSSMLVHIDKNLKILNIKHITLWRNLNQCHLFHESRCEQILL